jgi:hypothetical protein
MFSVFTLKIGYYFTGTPAGVAAKTGRHIGGIFRGQNYLEYR